MSQTNRSIVLPAQSGSVPGIYVETVGGNYFKCISSTGSFKVAPDDRSKLSMSTGRGFGSDSNKFRRLVFYNESASTITVEFYVGSEPYTADATATVVSGSAIANDIAACIVATPAQFLKTSTAAASPVALTSSTTYFRKAIVRGINALTGTANTGTVYIGPSSSANQQSVEIPPGGEYVIEPPNGAKDNFANWYLDVDTNADGVVVIYW